MKSLSCATLALLSVAMFSCKKNDLAPSSPAYAMMANRNNAMWTAAPTASYAVNHTTTDTIVIDGYKDAADHICLTLKRNKQGNYQLLEACTSFSSTFGEKMPCAYELDTTAGNSVQIVNIDHTKHMITGKFDLTFKCKGAMTEFPEVFEFKTGSFTSEFTE